MALYIKFAFFCQSTIILCLGILNRQEPESYVNPHKGEYYVQLLPDCIKSFIPAKIPLKRVGQRNQKGCENSKTHQKPYISCIFCFPVYLQHVKKRYEEYDCSNSPYAADQQIA